jgi:hypothetical protein
VDLFDLRDDVIVRTGHPPCELMSRPRADRDQRSIPDGLTACRYCSSRWVRRSAPTSAGHRTSAICCSR